MNLSIKLLALALVISVLASAQVQAEYSLSEFTDGMTNYPNITIKITDKFLSVRGGCNIHTGYFNVSEKSKVAIGPFSSTQIKCAKDYDSLLLKRLTTSTSFNLSNDILTLLDKDIKSLARFKKLTDEKVDINAIIEEIKNNASGNATNPNQASTSNQTSSSTQTKNDSNSQQQSGQSSQPGKSTESIAVNGGSDPRFNIEIEDLLKGLTKLSLKGTYKPTNINNDNDLLIVFEDGESVRIQNGCNIHSGIYNAFGNGTVTIGKFFSTRRACREDFDKIYLDALTKTDNYLKDNQNLILRNGANVLLTLTW